MNAIWKKGHWPSVLSGFLYFDISFMVWVMLGALGVYVSDSLHLTASQKGLMVALPILGGSVFRVGMGWLTDRIGARRTGLIGITLTLIPLFLFWVGGTTLPEVYAYGFLLGIAGASFAAALPLASRWYPPQHQGLVMGLVGAGNSGTLLATWFAPRLAEHYGSWHTVFGLAMIPVSLLLLLYWLMAKDSPNQPQPRPLADTFSVLKERDTWYFCFFYSITFGGFVGFASFLAIFFYDQYGLTPVQAGNFVTLCVIGGSFVRPIGGWLADRFGGIRMLTILFLAVGILMGLLSFLFPLPLQMGLLLVLMMCLGMGNGSVFQLIPQRFSQEIGVMTGLVGAAGGIGGFYLPFFLGLLKDWTGTFASGFLLLTIIGGAAWVTMLTVGSRWSRDWAQLSSERTV